MASLRVAPSLQSLQLGLRGHSIGDAGAQALALLRETVSLRALALDLSGNALGPEGVQAMEELWRASALHNLEVKYAIQGAG